MFLRGREGERERKRENTQQDKEGHKGVKGDSKREDRALERKRPRETKFSSGSCARNDLP